MKKPNVLTLTCLLATTAIVLASPVPPILQMRLVLDAPSADSEPMSYVIHDQDNTITNVLNVQKEVLFDQTALKSAKLIKDALGQPLVEITFTESGAKRLAEVTRRNIHKDLAIIIEGQVCAAPIIGSEVSGGVMQISGRFSKQYATDLASKINDALAKK